MNRDETLADLLARAEPLRSDPEKHEAELGSLIAQINAIRAEQDAEARAGVIAQIMAAATAVAEPEPVEPEKRGPGRPRKVQA
jgi:hypothetical protein